MSTGQVYRRLLGYVRPYKLVFALAILGNLLYGLVDASMVKFLEPLLDKGFTGEDPVFVRWIPAMIFGIFVVRSIAGILSGYCIGWVGRNVVMEFRRQLFAKILKLPTTYFDKTSSGELLSKLTYNTEQVAGASTEALTIIVREGFTTIGFLLVMLSINLWLTVLFLVSTPIMAFLLHNASKRLRKINTRVQGSMGDVTQIAEELISANKEIKIFGGQQREFDRFESAVQNNRRQEMKVIATSAFSVPAVQMVGATCLALTLYLATRNAEWMGITPGAFAAMVAAMLAILRPIKQITRVNGVVQRGIAGASSIFELLAEPTEIDEGSTECTRVAGEIRFEEVCFVYPEKQEWALDHVSFTIPQRKMVALVGTSGAGKTTLAHLIPRFYNYQEGRICIDGTPITSLSLQALRSQISMVSQHVTLFNNTIAYNVAYGLPNIEPEKIWEALHFAHAAEFVEALPNGLLTLIGENGVRLSGGQRQRLAIARAILKNAPILILDEATSALDTVSERHIQVALDNLIQRSTTLVIAHRLSTIEKADSIVVLEHGKVVGMGPHATLMQHNPAYARLVAAQIQNSHETTNITA